MTNKTISALVIPAEGLPYLDRVSAEDRGSYEFIRTVIPNLFDAVYSTDGTFHGYVDDEGLLNGLPINPIATALFGRVLVGPCVVFGAYSPDGERDGREYDVPRHAVESVEYLAGALEIWLEARPVASA